MRSIEKFTLGILSILIVIFIIIWVAGLMNIYQLELVANQKYAYFLPLLIMLLAILAHNISSREQIKTINQATRSHIEAMGRIEKDKQRIAIQSLLLELEYNKDIVNQYREHCKKGGHLGTHENKEICTWELVSPNFENYKLLALACYSDAELAEEINCIYSGLEECKIIIMQIHQFWSNNLMIKETIPNGRNLLTQEIIKYNGYLLQACEKIINSFDNSVNKLKFIKNSLH